MTSFHLKRYPDNYRHVPNYGRLWKKFPKIFFTGSRRRDYGDFIILTSKSLNKNKHKRVIHIGSEVLLITYVSQNDNSSKKVEWHLMSTCIIIYFL